MDLVGMSIAFFQFDVVDSGESQNPATWRAGRAMRKSHCTIFVLSKIYGTRKGETSALADRDAVNIPRYDSTWLQEVKSGRSGRTQAAARHHFHREFNDRAIINCRISMSVDAIMA